MKVYILLTTRSGHYDKKIQYVCTDRLEAEEDAKAYNEEITDGKAWIETFEVLECIS